jgi:hypothetical protein
LVDVIWIVAPALVAAFLGLRAWRWADHGHELRVWRGLANTLQGSGSAFDPTMVAACPEPARRFLTFAIRPGTTLSPVSEIRMSGEITLGTREQPTYLTMRAHQILASPHGLVWRLRARRGAVRISGSDGVSGNESWSRFWLFGVLPVARAGPSADHLKSAFGRAVAESVFFAPAALLPASGVTWEAVKDNVARATVRHNGMAQSVDVTVADDGRPTMVVLSRWSDANAERIYRYQPFGGYLSEFRDFHGYMLPTRIEGGNFIGTAEYFPFFTAEVVDVRFLRR